MQLWLLNYTLMSAFRIDWTLKLLIFINLQVSIHEKIQYLLILITHIPKFCIKPAYNNRSKTELSEPTTISNCLVTMSLKKMSLKVRPPYPTIQQSSMWKVCCQQRICCWPKPKHGVYNTNSQTNVMKADVLKENAVSFLNYWTLHKS